MSSDWSDLPFNWRDLVYFYLSCKLTIFLRYFQKEKSYIRFNFGGTLVVIFSSEKQPLLIQTLSYLRRGDYT